MEYSSRQLNSNISKINKTLLNNLETKLFINTDTRYKTNIYNKNISNNNMFKPPIAPKPQTSFTLYNNLNNTNKLNNIRDSLEIQLSTIYAKRQNTPINHIQETETDILEDLDNLYNLYEHNNNENNNEDNKNESIVDIENNTDNIIEQHITEQNTIFNTINNTNNQNKTKILLVSPYTYENLSILLDFTEQHTEYKYEIALLGWNNSKLDNIIIPENIETHTFKTHYSNLDTDPVSYIPKRIKELYQMFFNFILIRYTQTNSFDFYIIDYTCVEAIQAIEKFNARILISVPSFIGKNHFTKKNCHKFCNNLCYNSCIHECESLSNFLVYRNHKLLYWNNPYLINNFTNRKKINDIICYYPQTNNIYLTRNQVLIFFNPTILCNLWSNRCNEVRNEIINLIIVNLLYFINRTNYNVLIYTGDIPEQLITYKIPYHDMQRVKVSNTITTEDFNKSMLIIFNGSHITYNNCIKYCIPMIVYPFYGDQFEVSEYIQKNKFGLNMINFSQNKKQNTNAKSFYKLISEHDISKIYKPFLINIYKYKIKLDKLNKLNINGDRLSIIINNKINIKNGDLLIGTQQDLTIYINNFDKLNYSIYLQHKGAFCELIQHAHKQNILPLFIDTYHNVIFNKNTFNYDINNGSNVYIRHLLEYKNALDNSNLTINSNKYKLYNFAITYFIIKYNYNIHFIIGNNKDTKLYKHIVKLQKKFNKNIFLYQINNTNSVIDLIN